MPREVRLAVDADVGRERQLGPDGDREQLVGALKQQVRNAIGSFATPDIIHIASGLPKTRSGKIMRRILRKIAHNQVEDLGDTSTLADPTVVDDLIQNRGG